MELYDGQLDPCDRCRSQTALASVGGLVRVKLGTGSVLAACEHGFWFEYFAPEDARLRDLYLRGAAVGLREYARGNCVLHGSAVAFGGIGVAFVGLPGAGKSSIAAWLCRNGWTFISDAMTVVDVGTRLLLPMQPSIRLLDDSLRVLGEDPDAMSVDDLVTRKRRLELPPSSRSIGKARLAAVFQLACAEEIRVRSLEHADSMITLVKNAYLATRFGPEFSTLLLSLAAGMVNAGVHVYELHRPKNWNGFESIRVAIEATLFNDGLSDGA